MMTLSTLSLILAALVAFMIGVVLALAVVAIKLGSLDFGWLDEEEKV